MADRAVQAKERQEKLKDLILRLHAGESEDMIKEEFAQGFQTVSPLEISVMERKLMKEEGLSAQEIMRLCNVHVAIMADYIENPEDIPDDFQKPGHPVHVLKEENILIPMVTEEFDEADWIAIADEMDAIGYCIVKPLAK